MAVELTNLLDASCMRMDAHPDPVIVSGMVADSREVQPGWIFFAQAGLHRNGQQFIEDAIARGAVAIVTQNDLDSGMLQRYPRIAFVRVADVPETMARMAARYYETDCSRQCLIGVTGTNGKTTVVHFVQQLLHARGEAAVRIGTTGIEIADRRLPTDYTTPPAYAIHRYLREGREAGAKWVVMEVSSHGLKLNRVLGLQFDVAVFTNLTYEHAELHPTMEDYYQAKARLFGMIKPNGSAVINADDAYGQRLIRERKDSVRILDYGYQAKQARILDIQTDPTRIGQKILLHFKNKDYSVFLPIPGQYNAYNAVAALLTLTCAGLDYNELIGHMQSLHPPEGRFQIFEGANIRAVIDFAHTPDGLEKILSTVRPFVGEGGKLILIFGCPGDRDPAKRPLMGEIAARYADRIIVTSDDPHFEDPESVIRDIVANLSPHRYICITDRREAIRKGLELAHAGDWLLIAGRGHERYQYVRDEKIPFYDPDVLIEEAARLGLILKEV